MTVVKRKVDSVEKSILEAGMEGQEEGRQDSHQDHQQGRCGSQQQRRSPGKTRRPQWSSRRRMAASKRSAPTHEAPTLASRSAESALGRGGAHPSSDDSSEGDGWLSTGPDGA